jgi:hypothetical protein
VSRCSLLLVTDPSHPAAGRRYGNEDALLAELEDLNPHLSLEVLDAATLDRFVAALVQDLRTTIEEGR